MENSDTSDHSKRIPQQNSKSHVSMSDTESTTSQVDSFHSPLPSDSPLRSGDHLFRLEYDDSSENDCRSIVLVDRYSSPVPSPPKYNSPACSPASGGNLRRPWPHSEKFNPKNLDVSPRGEEEMVSRRSQHQPVTANLDFSDMGEIAGAAAALNKIVREEPASEVKKVGPVGGGRLEVGYGGRENEVGGERRSREGVPSMLKRSARTAVVKKVALGFRVFAATACLISFSVMAADKTRGWSGDSFDRYMEYRYCLAVNVIGFAYSAFQAFDLTYNLAAGKHVFAHYLRCHFDFAMDQILAYLVMSASSSAATRVADWISNWGRDEFTLLASSSVAMSFLAFIAFALSSLVSGYNLCNRDST